MGIQRILPAVAIGALCWSTVAPAQPSSAIKVVDPLTFTWRDTAQGPTPFVFQVFSADGTLADLKATVTDVRGPLGPLDASAWRASTLPATTTPRSGAQVTITPPNVADASEYRVTVLLTASRRSGDSNDVRQASAPLKGSDVEDVRQLIVTRPAAQLALDEVNDLTVRLIRWCPWWCEGYGTFTAHVSNNQPVRVSASLDSESVTENERKSPAAGTVRVTAADGGTSLDLPPDGRAEVTLALSGFDSAGKFKSAIVMQGPALAGRQRAAITVEVTDGPVMPFLTVLLGVLLGSGLQWITRRWRPQQENRFRILSLRTAAKQFAEWSDSHRIQVEPLLGRLVRAEEHNLLEDAATAKTEIDAIEQEFDALVKAEGVRLRQLSDRYEALRPRTRSPEDEKTFASIETDLREHQLDQADAKLRGLEAPSAGLKGARPREGDVETAQPVRRGIDLVESPDELIAGARLRFYVRDPPPGAEKVEWDFGDGAGTSKAKDQIRHSFLAPGRYRVKAAVEDANGQVLEERTHPVVILPPSEERAAKEIHKLLRRQAWVTTGISVIVASLTAFGTLYLGGAFGSGQQYLAAFLWGFGIDATVRQSSDVFKRLGGG